MNRTTCLVDPSAPSQNEAREEHRPLNALAGKVVGFIDNAKPNFNYLARDIADILVEKHGIKSTVIHRKGAASIPAANSAVAELAKTCDLVITGSGD